MALEPPRTMRIAVIIAVPLCAAALAACGSSASSTARSAAGGSETATATTTVTHTASQTTSGLTTSTSTSTGSSGPATCRAGNLALSFLGGQGATGHGELGFALRNASSASCLTGGYPGVLFLDRSGRGLPTTPDHTTSDFFGHTTLRTLTVAPGQTVSFRLGVSHVGTGGSSTGCVSAAGLQVIAPNDTGTLRLRFPHGAIAECGGTVTVSPLQPGTSALR